MNQPNTPKFLAVDFYCGAGGTTRGLLNAGGYVIAGIDKDENCRKTYEYNNTNATLDYAPAKFLAFDMLPSTGDYPGGEQDKVWKALHDLVPRYQTMAPGVPLMFAICAPCQSFTKFVQRNLSDETRGKRERDQSLLSQTLAFIADFNPDMIVSENVSTIKRGSHRALWVGFQEALSELGFAIGDADICASRFGIPQHRRRSILMAVKNEDSAWRIPVPDHDSNTSQLSVQDAIGHLPAIQAGATHPAISGHTCRNLTEISRQRLMSVKPGESNDRLSDSPYGDWALPCHRSLEEIGNP